MNQVIILDGHLKSALAAVRSLGRRGIPVICGSHRSTGMSLASRYCAQTFVYPSPLERRDDFIDAIIVAARSHDHSLIMSFSDSSFLPLAERRDQVENVARLALPSKESVAIAFDKAASAHCAQELGIAVPESFFHRDESELRSRAAQWSYPMVVKPLHSCTWAPGRGITATAHIVHSPEELIRQFAVLHQQTKEMPFIQRYVDGTEYGVSVLCDRGRVVASCTHERIRSLSPDGGASVMRRTVSPYPEMLDAVRALMEKLAWHGVAMVEFKRDRTSGTPYFIEINGRFWGSLPLAVAAGADFPFLLYALTFGMLLPEVRCAPQTFSRYLLGDIKHLASVLFARSAGSSSRPLRLKAVREFFASFGGGIREDVWSLSDPKPFFMDIIDKLT